MKRTRIPSAMAVCALGLTGLALTASGPMGAVSANAEDKPRQCFRAQDWHGSSAAGPRDLYLRVGIKDVWHLAMAQDCSGARFPGPLKIEDVVTGSNEICSGLDLQIRVGPQGGSYTDACIVRSINKLTPEEIKALPPRAIP